MRTRFWSSDEGSSTAVQWRDDVHTPCWFHTNIGWVPLANVRTEEEAAEIAKGYNLIERDEATARYMAGEPEEDGTYPVATTTRNDLIAAGIDVTQEPYLTMLTTLFEYEHGTADPSDVHPDLTMAIMAAVIQDLALTLHHK